VLEQLPDPDEPNECLNHIYSSYKVEYRDFTGHRATDPDKPSPTILARGNGKGGVCAIPHYNGKRRLTIRESATIQTFPEDFEFIGQMNSCYRQIGNAVPVRFAKLIGLELVRLEREAL
jgi:DNA (cytosine-5)-methyltransferase 1